MGEDTSQIRREIEATRARMEDTVEAIGYKADVPSRVRETVSARIASVKGTIDDVVGGTAAAVAGKAQDLSDATTSVTSSAASSTKGALSVAVENPLGLALGALAVGFLGGLLLPISDVERQRIGPVGEQVANRAQVAVSEAVEAGKTVLSEAIAGAAESAQKRGAEILQQAVAPTDAAGG